MSAIRTGRDASTRSARARTARPGPATDIPSEPEHNVLDDLPVIPKSPAPLALRTRQQQLKQNPLRIGQDPVA